jgi:hypothetical protein
MKSLRCFAFARAPGLSVADVVSIPFLSTLLIPIHSSRTGVKVPIDRMPSYELEEVRQIGKPRMFDRWMGWNGKQPRGLPSGKTEKSFIQPE